MRNRPSPLDFDEWIGVIVSLGTIGGIFFWATSRNTQEMGFNQSPVISYSMASTSPSPTEIPENKSLFSPPSKPVTPDDNRSAVATPKPDTNLTQPLAIIPPISNPIIGKPAVNSANPKPGKSPAVTKSSIIEKPTPSPEKKTDKPVELSIPDPPKVDDKKTPKKSLAVKPKSLEPKPEKSAKSTPNQAANPAKIEDKSAKKSPEKSAPNNPNSPQVKSAKTIKITDVPNNYWAKELILPLTEKGVMSPNKDGKFEPDKPVTRAELAAALNQVFQPKKPSKKTSFKDVPQNYWAHDSIMAMSNTGFLKGYPKGVFNPDQLVPRVQVLASIVSGLDLNIPSEPRGILRVYQDRKDIPNWAIGKTAAATNSGLVVNYPNKSTLNPTQPATRADVAAMIHQALVLTGKTPPIKSEYIVKD